MMLAPAMQGIIMAIAKARQVFDKDGPEAGLIKVSQCVQQSDVHNWGLIAHILIICI